MPHPVGRPGSHTITGNFIQNLTGTLDIQASGTAAGSYGMLNITGAAAWGNSLAFDLLNGFTLSAGDVFDIAPFGSDPDNFSAFSLDGVACASSSPDDWSRGGWNFDEMFTATSLDLDVTAGGGQSPGPEPASLTLVGSALAALGWLWRKRRMPPAATPRSGCGVSPCRSTEPRNIIAQTARGFCTA
jgi:hypothetical protein